ncbi:sugar ABC transporter ATPase [Herbaspirillum rubrisubalbicans M1]|uniref:ABC transporter ATP-binding protein n=1 Tax=Herbaspirillum rubrisubalbicans TaxID=80842 RepID=UPI00073A237C|nr:ABC transporter ATP-binding protein [Herbaspirillum rubrisubalbicans]ALU89592.1 sugar ABC transporter ATPase [Herbaspirillum rubrisubalbicans M1]
MSAKAVMGTPGALLELRDVSKLYPNGTLANDNVNLSIRAGEIHAILGENGAGKSTVMKMLYGLEQPSCGNIWLDGQPRVLPDPAHAIAAGIGLVPQHLHLLPSFSVTDNIVLGAEPRRGWRIDRKAALQRVQSLVQRFGLDVDPLARVRDLPVGVQQRVGILKALYRGARVLLLDEPSAVLSAQEAMTLFQVLRGMVAQGLTVVLISHKLKEIRDVADRFTVLRKGRVSGSGLVRDFSETELGSMIVSTAPPPMPARNRKRATCPLLEVRDLEARHGDGRLALRSLSLDIAAGEILGIAGVEGNGQDVLARVLLGLQAASRGEGRLQGLRFTGLSVRQVRACGVAYIAEDRMHDGVAAEMSIADNLIAVTYHKAPFSRYGWLDSTAIGRAATALMQRCGIVAPSPATLIGALSGGNMQKLVLGREVAAGPRLLIASQPTRGVDIGAARALHDQLLALCEQGAAILLISADLDELLSLSDRVAVMADGALVAHFDAAGLGADVLGPYLTGARCEQNAAALLGSAATVTGVSA